MGYSFPDFYSCGSEQRNNIEVFRGYLGAELMLGTLANCCAVPAICLFYQQNRGNNGVMKWSAIHNYIEGGTESRRGQRRVGAGSRGPSLRPPFPRGRIVSKYQSNADKRERRTERNKRNTKAHGCVSQLTGQDGGINCAGFSWSWNAPKVGMLPGCGHSGQVCFCFFFF